MKHIKDYLHLYIGCEIRYPDTDGKMITATLTGVSRGDGLETTYKRKRKNCSGDYLAWKKNPYHNCTAFDAKLVLRPLSDMTDEEKAGRDKAGKVGWELVKEAFVLGSFPIERAIHLRHSHEIHYLLSRGFDLFGLIDDGLAIDKTKL